MNQVMKSLVMMEHNKIRTLEERIDSLEMEADKREQYSRRPKYRFQSIPEKPNETTNQFIMETIKQTMDQTNLNENQLERSHRVGPKENKQRQPRERPIIVRFRIDTSRDSVFCAESELKIHSLQNRGNAIFIKWTVGNWSVFGLQVDSGN